MPKPEISIVIPLYNKGPYVARALNSVLEQTFKDFEVIVVNDGSTDDGAKIVRDFDDPRILLIQQRNHGVSGARNNGVEVSQAEMIAFLDADDEWMSEHLTTLLKLSEHYPEAGAYGTACLIKIDDSSQRIASYSAIIPNEPWEGLLPSYFRAAALGFPPITASTVAIPKKILKEVGGFSTATWFGEDIDLWGRIALKYPIAFSWKGMGIYHTDDPNRACNRIDSIEENNFIHTAMKAIASGEVSPDMETDLLEYIAERQITAALFNIRAGKRELAREILKKCKTRELIRKKHLALLVAYAPPIIFSFLMYLKRLFFRY